MQVEILFYSDFRRLIGKRQLLVDLPEGARLADLIEFLTEKYGIEFQREALQISDLGILINGRKSYFLQGLKTPFCDGDTIVFLKPLMGG